MRTVTVKSGNYKVLIGPGLLREAGERIARTVRGRRCAVVTDDRVGPLYAKLLVTSLKRRASAPTSFPSPTANSTRRLRPSPAPWRSSPSAN